ncbi:MAG: FprA family A-type flavoprotein [Armatimonadota bacterium]|nr:FprA family A-type flavoprotein [Armatimonadota bacterium]
MHVELTEGIDWVGVIDWNVRDFHGYHTGRGSTYNAYLVRGEQVALIDTVKHAFADTLLRNIDEVVGHDAVDYVIANHGEPDHSSALPAVMEACHNAILLTNEKCVETLEGYYDTGGWDIDVVESGDSVDLHADRSLTFVQTPMVHWPDSMVSYCPEEKILFSNDAFGQHLASSGRFDDQVELPVVMQEAKTYYANIVMLYGRPIARAMEALGELQIGTIAPAHGAIWRSHVPQILDAYGNWVRCRPRAKVLVIYESMWGSTDRMAHEIVRGAAREGVEVRLFDLSRTDRTVLATEILDAAAVAVGSPTLNMTLMPGVAGLLTYLKGLSPKHKAGFAFGSYGWAPGGPREVQEYLEAMSVEILREPLTAQWRPGEDALAQCREAGRMLADHAEEAAANGHLYEP